MKRRAVLISASILFSGCTSQNASPNPSNTDTTTRSPTPSSTPTQTSSPTEARPDEADEQISTAEARLQDAVTAYNEQVGTLYSPSRDVTFSTDSVEVHLSAADDALSSAKPLATEDQIQKIAALRAYHTYLEQLVAVLKDHAAATASFETGREEFGSGAYESAIGTFQTSRDHLGNARQGVESARSKLSDLEETTIDREKVAYSEAKTALTSLDSWFKTMENLLDGYESNARGLIRFDRGAEYYDREFYDSAKDMFEVAVDHLTSATESYPKPDETGDQSLKVYYSSLQCRSNSALKAVKYMVDACTHMVDGEKEKANEKVGMANDELSTEC